MESSDLIRKMLDAVQGSYAASVGDKEMISESKVEIEIEGPEVDDFLDRLLKLAGQEHTEPEMPDAALPVATALPDDTSIDLPAMAATDSKYVCDDCGESPEACACHADKGVCEQCGMPESMCECDMAISTAGPLQGMSEQADFDHGHDDEHEPEDEGKTVDPTTYMWRPSTASQRLVKGVMGDNPLTPTSEGINQFKRIVNDYVSFLRESDIPNEAGAESPFTAADRQEFDRDPNRNVEPVTDGSRSPMTDIKRQDVMK